MRRDRVRLRRGWNISFASATALLAWTGALYAQDSQSSRFQEHVDVRVRQIVVMATDARGQPVPTLEPRDLQIKEGSEIVEIVGVERLQENVTDANGRQAPSTAREVPPALAPRAPQVLYLDTDLLNRRTVPLVSKAFLENLDGVLRGGPLEIVVAKPEPKTLLPATADPKLLRQALKALPKEIVGSGRLLDIRRDTLEQIANLRANMYPANSASKASAVRTEVYNAVRSELLIVNEFASRLEAWAAERGIDRAGTVYVASDGFDSDPTEIYRTAVFGDEATSRELQDLTQDFGGQIPTLMGNAAATLTGRGLVTIVLSLGGTSAELASGASNLDKRGGLAIRRPAEGGALFFYARPFEPMRSLAVATGGELVASASHFSHALDRLGTAYLVSFRPARKIDATRVDLDVQSVRAGLVVRGPSAEITGTSADISLARVRRCLSACEAGALPVEASLRDLSRSSPKSAGGTLVVKTDLSPLARVLDVVGEPLLRVSLAVELEGSAPFTRQEEIRARRSGEGLVWTYEVRLNWPPEARRIAVEVDELQTNSRGHTVVSIP